MSTDKKPTQANRSLNSVQRKIYARGHTLTDVADATGHAVGTVSQVACGRSRSPKIQQAIADSVGMTPPALFGDLCHPSLRRRPDNSHVGGREHDATHPPRTAEVAA